MRRHEGDLRRCGRSQSLSIGAPSYTDESIAPSPHCLIGDDYAPLSQKQLDVTQAEAEYVIQPHSMANDRGREAMAVVRVGWLFRGSNLAYQSRTANAG